MRLPPQFFLLASFVFIGGGITSGLWAQPSPTMDPALKARIAASPFADKPCSSYSSYSGEDGQRVFPIWGQAPFRDFGSRTVQFDQTGVRAVAQAPAHGVHPRIFFGPAELPEVRKRVKETRCGQEAWKNILCWTEAMKGTYDDSQDYAKPDRTRGGWQSLHSRVPLWRLGMPFGSTPVNGSKWNKSDKAAALYAALADGTATEMPDYYWNAMALEAFRCLITDDKASAEKLAQVTMTATKLSQAKRDSARAQQQAKKPDQPLPPIDQPVGSFQFAYIYDFIYNWLTPEQRQTMHAELAETTWSHDNYGTFNNAHSSRSNWATFSYWLYQVLAIEGEPGFNELKVFGMYRGWRNLLNYGWFESGATFEGEAKNQLGMDGILLFAARQKAYGFENLAGHPYLRAYATKFLPHSANPMLTGFHKYDLLGGSRAGSGGFAPADSLGLKFLFPEDKVIDWYYRQTVDEDYSGVPEHPHGYFNALLFFAIYATDFDPANNDVKKLNLGNTFFCGERALMMTRSSWDKDAMMLNMHTRQMNGGHPFSDRNAIMVAGAGRIWSPNGYATFRTTENSVVSIDDQSQNENVPGRLVDFQDQPLATFAIGDAKYCWDWTWKRLEKSRGYYTKEDVTNGTVVIPEGWEPVRHTVNDFAFKKLDFAYLNKPAFEYDHWILPDGALSPYVRQPLLPVQRAFRTAGLVRGPRPYALIVDDIQMDTAPHRYDWRLLIENDIQIVKVEKIGTTELQIILTGSDPDQLQPKPSTPLPPLLAEGTAIPDGQPMLLVRVLNHNMEAGQPTPEPTIVTLDNPASFDKKANKPKYAPTRLLLIPSLSVTPDYKVLLYAYRQGQPLPEIKRGNAQQYTVAWADQKDELLFTPQAGQKTNLTVKRAGQEIIALTKVIAPLAEK